MRNFLFAFLLVFTTSIVFAQSTSESLKINWPEEEKWTIGTDQEDGAVHMVELTSNGESLKKWSIIGSTMTINGVVNVPMDIVMKMMHDQALMNAPKATVTLIEKEEGIEYPWIIFKIEAPRFNNDKNPESQLYYAVQGKTALFTNFVAIKEKTLSAEFVDKWAAIFKQSELQ